MRPLPLTKARDVYNYLLTQADGPDPWIDVVVRGMAPVSMQPGAPLRSYSWVYSRRFGAFVPDQAIGSVDYPGIRRFADFLRFQQHPGMRNVFLGVPLGKGERLGRNFDGDSLLNGEETMWGCVDPGSRRQRGSDGYDSSLDNRAPQLVRDSFRLLLSVATHAQFAFEAKEDVRWDLQVQDQSGSVTFQSRGAAFAKQHTIHAHGLFPGGASTNLGLGQHSTT